MASFSSPSIRIAILVRRNYWTVEAGPSNGNTHRSVPDIVAALRRAGGTPELVYQGSNQPRAEHFDAIVLPGGGDIHPRFYGQSIGQGVDAHSLEPDFDEFQLDWARQALELEMPILGICRGLQVLNVAAGGTLIQDIATAGQHLDHAPQRVLENPALRGEAVHSIDISADSQLRRILGHKSIAVNSIHHQSVDRLAPGFRAVAWAQDGIVEAVENSASPWQRGVQFHPEDMRDNPGFQRIFETLVNDAAHALLG